jgi:hypothetical protein
MKMGSVSMDLPLRRYSLLAGMTTVTIKSLNIRSSQHFMNGQIKLRTRRHELRPRSRISPAVELIQEGRHNGTGEVIAEPGAIGSERRNIG